jgi:hypothetical protein
MSNRNRYPARKPTLSQWATARKGQHDAHVAPWLHLFAEENYAGAPSAYVLLRDKARCIDPSFVWIDGAHRA